MIGQRLAKFFLLSAFVALGTAASDDENSFGDDRYTMRSQCLDALQKQISHEIYASLTYLNMAAHFHNGKIGRNGFYKFFNEQSIEEREHAMKLIKYINKRGGKVSAFDVSMPIKASWSSAEEAIQDAINLEKDLNVKLHVIHGNAEKICHDPHLMDFLEQEYLEEQISSISKLNKMLSVLKSFEGKETGEYLVDLELFKEPTAKYYEEL